MMLLSSKEEVAWLTGDQVGPDQLRQEKGDGVGYKGENNERGKGGKEEKVTGRDGH